MSSVVSRRSLLRAGGASVAFAAVSACSSGSSKSVPSATTTPVRNPDDALRRLLDGNKRFVDNKLTAVGRDDVRRAEQAEHQTPFAIVVGCSDSRVLPEVIFDEGIGDLFLVRVAGNTAAAPVLIGSVEYAATTFSCHLVLVLGHESCGAVKAAIDVGKKGKTLPGSLPSVVEPILPSVQRVKDLEGDELVNAVTRGNILATVNQLRTSDSLLRDLIAAGTLKVVGAEYHLHSGEIEVLD